MLEKMNFIDVYTPEILGGLIVAILLLVINHIYLFFKNYIVAKKYSGYIGQYLLYRYSATGLRKIIVQELTIKQKFGKLKVYVNDNDIYKYMGTMFITERNLYINYEGVDHVEQMHLIFHSPLHRSIIELIGTSNLISPIDEPVASYCILSNSEISEEIVTEKFDKLLCGGRNTILKVPKDITLYFDNLAEVKLNEYN